MVRKVLDLFGLIRTLVMITVLGAVAIALSTAGVPPLGVVTLVAGLAFVLWRAPFGAKYRKNF